MPILPARTLFTPADKLLLLGMSERTGYFTAKALLEGGCQLDVRDQNVQAARALCDRLAQETGSTKMQAQTDTISEGFAWESYRMVVVAPGVPAEHSLLQAARAAGVEVVGDIELFYRFYPDLVYLGVTGTDGKSTTATWAYHLIQGVRPVHLAGNIGTAIFALFEKVSSGDVVVLELSSYQLETVQAFRAQYGVFLNLAEAHLRRHGTMQAYADAKARMRPTHGWLLPERADPQVTQSVERALQGMVPQPTIERLGNAYAYDAQKIMVDGAFFCARAEFPRAADYHVENFLAAAYLARHVGVTVEHMRKVMVDLPRLAHRFSLVAEAEGVRYINDSKATTLQSVERALQAAGSAPVVLLIGGQNTQQKWHELSKVIAQHVKALVLLGETASDVAQEYTELPQARATDMLEAVRLARSFAETGDMVLLAPGAPSFDSYASFEERGRLFEDAVTFLLGM